MRDEKIDVGFLDHTANIDFGDSIWRLNFFATELACLVHEQTYDNLYKYSIDLDRLVEDSEYGDPLREIYNHSAAIINACANLRRKNIQRNDNSEIIDFYRSVIAFEDKVSSYFQSINNTPNTNENTRSLFSHIVRTTCCALIIGAITALALSTALSPLVSIACGIACGVIVGTLYFLRNRPTPNRPDNVPQINMAEHPARLFSNNARLLIQRDYANPLSNENEEIREQRSGLSMVIMS